MAVLITGNSFTTADQVTAATLNAATNSATFASGAVDGSTTQLSSGAIIVKDGGVGSSKLASSLVLVTPNLGTPSAGVLTNCTGTAAGLTAGAVTINANLTGDVTSVGNATTVVTNANLTGGVTSVGNAATVVTNANLTGDVTSVGNATSIASGVIVNADINASAAIVDTKLDTIATALKVSNSATTAASANTASAIVARDGSGNFSAGTITANLTGNASGSSGSTTGNAATATALATGRTIAITGDLSYTSPSFNGTANVTAVGTLATVASSGTTGSSTAIPVITINAKGLTTGIGTAAVVAPAGTLSGATLASGVTASSLTSLGTITSINVTGGSIVGITDLAIADGGTGASTKAGALTALGLLQSNLNSNLSTASAVTQSGTLGADKVFDTPNAPTVSLTAGTWLVTGSVGCRTSDNSDNVWAQFYNNTDAAAFGGGCSIDSNVTDGLYRRSLSVSGIITVASGTKVIYFKCFRAGSSTLDIGAGVGPSGFIQAVQLYA